MKKSLILLPLLAALALVGCGKEEAGGNNNGGNSDDTEVDDGFIDKLGPDQVGVFKRVDEPELGKSYVFGYYDYNSEELRLANGKYHSDSKGFYPYYMATEQTTEDSDELARFTLEDGGTGKYMVKVSCADTEKPWHNKYMSIYSATSSYDNLVFSIAPVDDVDGQYQPLDKQLNPNGDPVDVIGRFDFVKDDEVSHLSTIGISVTHAQEVDADIFRTFGCAYGSYVSIDCSSIDKAIGDDYSVAHFYEIVE